jgi:type I restriction enzyme M protein
MLDTDTKRRIDTARDILVGKVPDPKSQVEQITIALIYKFMDDMDAESEEFGGKRKFFANEFARYGWAKLMRSGLGGHETLNLYAEAIAKMPENPGIPLLFRDIFKNAYLPYRDPETLKMFLKVIDEFTYDHSERLGDAFEYLLSVLGSQGEAGQFRTPRHIIDFMVAVIDPKKTETMLDPACGTAGFEISSYKHILKANTDASGNSTLTPDEKGRLAQNFRGYDISPDMVRLSLVNMYLHGFADPHIFEYDTLTSQERWNEYADIILANPPFMSPKGGIKPHNRFSVQSKRSEVLFVDYMAEHLTPSGRAGIIVPEGIIFQSQTAYKQLRKMLVEEYLVAVVSLPAGVFNPYSGVKTSILILDKTLAKKANTIAFFKVENDGFGLGAQRREIDKNDLPQAHAEIGEYLRRLRAGESVEDFQPTLGLIVEKEKVAANGEYNLSGERYRENGKAQTVFPFRSVGDIAEEIKAGFASGQSSVATEGVPHIRPMNVTERGQFTWEGVKRITEAEFAGKEDYALRPGDILFNNTNSKELVGKTCLIEESIRGGFSNHMTRIRVKPHLCVPPFLALLLHNSWQKGEFLERANRWVGQAGINAKSLSEYEIPLPPLEVQKEIVAEIEGYQKIINGARAVLDHYRPHILIHPDWPMVELGEVCVFKRGPFGGSLKKEIFVKTGYVVYEQSHAIANDFSEFRYFVDEDKFAEMHGFQVRPGELIMSCSGTMGKVAIIPDNAPAGIINQALLKLTPKDCVLGVFLKLWMESTNFQKSLADFTYGAAIKNVASVEILKSLRLPLPPLATQQAIVAEIEAEQALVAANRELITRFDKKIQATLARVWGEEA